MDFSFESALGVPNAKIGFQKSHGEEINRIINNFKYEKTCLIGDHSLITEEKLIKFTLLIFY
jgi:hypothetical protein